MRNIKTRSFTIPKQIMILAFLFMLYNTVQPQCSQNAIYYFGGLSSSTNSITSSNNSTVQPFINFPSLGPPFDTTKDPSKSNPGVVITYQKYLKISPKWSTTTDGAILYISIYHISGTLGTFIEAGLQNWNQSKLIKISGVMVSGVQKFKAEIGSYSDSSLQFNYGWNQVVLRLGNNKFDFQICKYNSCASMYNSVYLLDTSGNLQSTDLFYFGCKSCTDTSVKYILSSIQFLSDSNANSCLSNPLLTLFYYSNYFPCGDLNRDGSETCDDGNLDNGDGCNNYCRIESYYTCIHYGSNIADQCYRCGDGKKFTAEPCEDGNTYNNDGCSSVCVVESGWTCTGGTITSKDTCIENCGDGIRFNTLTTYCDDGNKDNGDGCSSTCATETGWKCTGGNSKTKDTCTEKCGDGVKFNAIITYCDDGNTNNGDGCNSSCTIETGWACTGGSSSTKDTCNDICGDGKKYSSSSTFCDDGDTDDGDGCSSTCVIEAGWKCTGGSSSAKDTCTELCGDGTRFNTNITYCDDGNTKNGDGCNSLCAIETGWTCTGGSSSAKDICSDFCGDGKKYSSSSTFCDDGDTDDGDGCNSTCVIEAGWKCTGGSSSTKDTCTELCGDGKRFNTNSTYCDDGNTISGDGCSSTCVIESGYSCIGGDSMNPDNCGEKCGDGKRLNTISTYCDDGNVVDGDGCSSTCSIEAGWICVGGNSTTKDKCEKCGDGVRLNTLTNNCDDWNNVSGDGCSSTCTIETGWKCTGGNSITKDNCTEICGDGVKFNAIITYCDDGNTNNGDGCNSSCTIETGWSCTGGSFSTKDTCNDTCGDGKKYNSSSTFCDDGDTDDGDGCSSTCVIEAGWKCTGGSSSTKDTCTEICGDGMRFNTNSTYCDDGNTKNGDGCNSSCTIETGWICTGGNSSTKDTCTEKCGDGIRFNTKSTYCDDGNTIDGDGCSSVCSVEVGWGCIGGTSLTTDKCEYCGDGKRIYSYQNYCDDGNAINNDGCSSVCHVENGWTCAGGSQTSKDICTEICGDGIRFNTIASYCDDGNLNSSDGCSSKCSTENGWKCTGGSSQGKDTCAEVCGDGIRFNSISNYCDDGNLNSDDGCSTSCQVDYGWYCSGGNQSTKDTCIQLGDQSKSKIGEIIAFITVGIVAISCLCNLASPLTFWITINHLQLILLLLIMKCQIPRFIEEFISKLNLATCSFNFIPFKDIPGFSQLIKLFDYSISIYKLDNIGIFSGSSIANNFSLICIVLIFACIHGCFLMISRLLKAKVNKTKKCKKCMEKTYQFFTFSLYLRILLEASMFMMLSSYSEIFNWDASNNFHIVSLLFAFALFIICVLLALLSVIIWLKQRKVGDISNLIQISELLNGINDKSLSRLYWLFFLLRRAILIIILVSGSSFTNTLIVCLTFIIQILYTALIIFTRPFKEIKNNLIKIINELFYILLVCLLFYYNSSSRWEETIQNAYFWIIICNMMVIVFISIVAFIISSIMRLIQSLKIRESQNDIHPKIHQNEDDNRNQQIVDEYGFKDFSNFKVSNATPTSAVWKLTPNSPIQKEQESAFVLNEEIKQETTLNFYIPPISSTRQGMHEESKEYKDRFKKL